MEEREKRIKKPDTTRVGIIAAARDESWHNTTELSRNEEACMQSGKDSKDSREGREGDHAVDVDCRTAGT